MGPYKLIALDMDGTTLSNEHIISSGNAEWIHKAINAGVTVMFATGRGVQSVGPYVEQLNLRSPMVSVNGSEVWKAPGLLLKRHLMEHDWIRSLHKLAVDHNTWYWGYTVEGLFNRENWSGPIEDYRWLKFGFQSEDAEAIKTIRGILEESGLYEITNSHPTNLEINPFGVSKASGMMEVCNLLQITMDEVIAMGDSENDLLMIKAAGLGVAMGNAQEKVKLAADVVTLTNDEDGVARIIREYIFHEKE